MLIWQGDIDKGMGKRFMLACWAMLAAEVAVANIWWTPEGVKGILLGGIIANLNIIGTFRDTNRIVKFRTSIVYYIGVLTRLVLTGVVIVTFIKKFPGSFSFLGIFIGLSVVPLAFFILVFQAILTRRRIEDRKDLKAEEKD
ncbi:MAG: hypothetical protein DSZ23_01775 [Thermodesulfatator sp.]|nr:MAG: hypothetical protein DSZ23_01775 [Thermodesulfatator sp.]